MSIIWIDPVTGGRGYLVIDRVIDGLCGGGIRLREGVTLHEVEALARAMSHKNGWLELPVGGCKLGLEGDPHDPQVVQLLTRFLTAIAPLLESSVVTGEDLGTTREMVQEALTKAGIVTPVQAVLNRVVDPEATLKRCVRALAAEYDGVWLVDLVGGYGVAEATEAASRMLGIRLDQASVSLQGFGSIGGSAARFLVKKGARVVALSDVHGTLADVDGLDVEAMLRGQNRFGEIDRSALSSRVRLLPPDEWLEVEADIVIPAAVPYAIDVDNCERLRARLIVEAANLPTTPAAERRLHERGIPVIPDFVANSGTNAFFWWLLLDMVEPTPQAVMNRIRSTMGRLVPLVLESSSREGILPRDAALRLAIANLDRMTGPH